VSGFAKLVDLVSGVETITQLDPASENRIVEVTFGTGKIAITSTTQADIDAAQDALAYNAARREGQAMSYDEFMQKLTSRKSSGG
jgi:hypothetical protein